MEKERIKKVIDWLLNSGIQNADGACDRDGFDVAGSFNAWYDLSKKQYPLAYSEISGYGLTLLAYLYEETKDAVFFERAGRVAEWLLKIQHPSGAFPTAFYFFDDSPGKPAVFCTFDAGMVLNGLANYYRQSKEEKYLTAAKKSADWILGLQKKDGSIPAMVDEKMIIKDNDGTWSSQPGVFHAKLSIGFLNLHDLTHDNRYSVFSRKICDYALTRMQEDGSFLTYGKLNGTHLHPHSYAAEGLFAAGIYLNEQKYLKAAKKATEWAVSKNKDGLIPRFRHGDNFNYNERVDVLAQTYRLARLLEIAEDNQEKILGKILGYQYIREMPAQRGGFMFGRLSSGELMLHINSWVSFFALQALKLKEKDGNFKFYYLV